MSTLLNDCPECGRPLALSYEVWMASRNQEICGAAIGSMPASEECSEVTITRLKARVTELEAIVGPRLRVWELSGGDIWVVALTEEECWIHLEEQHGNTDEVTEYKEDGSGWAAFPDDKKITMYVDEDGDVCDLGDGTPCAMPAWVWAVRHGAGFFGETE